MHKNVGRPPVHIKTDKVTIRPLDVITYLEGSESRQGVVLATKPELSVGRLLVNEVGEIHRICGVESVPQLAVLSLENRLPIQVIIDGLARQFSPVGYDLAHAQTTVLGALGDSAIEMHIF